MKKVRGMWGRLTIDDTPATAAFGLTVFLYTPPPPFHAVDAICLILLREFVEPGFCPSRPW